MLATLAVALACQPRTAAAHGPIHEQIRSLTARIAADPRNATLYLRRGQLQSEHGDWKAALLDYDRAQRIDSKLAGLGAARGRTLLDAGREQDAKVVLDAFLADHPTDAGGLATRARACLALGLRREAAEDYARAIAVEESLGRPNPDSYLERARILAAEGSDAALEALRTLDQGLHRLGPIPSLQLPAIDLELARGRYDEALARVDEAAAHAPSPEPWLARRGDVLERAGRRAEARATYEQALVELASRSTRRRPTKSGALLEAQVRSALERVRDPEPVEEKP